MAERGRPGFDAAPTPERNRNAEDELRHIETELGHELRLVDDNELEEFARQFTGDPDIQRLVAAEAHRRLQQVEAELRLALQDSDDSELAELATGADDETLRILAGEEINRRVQAMEEETPADEPDRLKLGDEDRQYLKNLVGRILADRAMGEHVLRTADTAHPDTLPHLLRLLDEQAREANAAAAPDTDPAPGRHVYLVHDVPIVADPTTHQFYGALPPDPDTGLERRLILAPDDQALIEFIQAKHPEELAQPVRISETGKPDNDRNPRYRRIAHPARLTAATRKRWRWLQARTEGQR